MEVINNQYRFIETLYTEPKYSTLLVLDEKDQNLYQLIAPTGPLPKQLIDYVKNNLLKFFFFDDTYVVRFLGIGRIFSIDNIPSISSRFFFVSEYIEPQIDFTSRISNMNFEQKRDIALALCRSLNYVHTNGFSYGGFSGNDLIILFDGTNTRIKINDFVGLKIKNYLDTSNPIKARVLKNDNSQENMQRVDQINDMVSLGTVLLQLLLERPLRTSPKQELSALSKLYENTDCQEAALLPIINKLLNLSLDVTYEECYYPYHVAEEIANAYNQNIIIIDAAQKVPELFANITGCDKEISRAIEIYTNAQKGLEKPIMLIEGPEGVGKSNFGIAIATYLRFKDVYSFSYYIKKDKTPDEHWSNFVLYVQHFSELMGLSDYTMQLQELISKYDGIELKSKQIKCLLEILNQVPKNISLLIKIDDIHFADDFFVQTILYIAKETNVFFLLTYNNELLDRVTKTAICDIIDNNEYKKIHLQNLTAEDIKPFLENILQFEKVSDKLVAHIFISTSGNPELIISEVRRLIQEKIIVQDEKTGFYYYLDNTYSIPENQNAQTIIATYTKKTPKDIELDTKILEYISLFEHGAHEKWIPNFNAKRSQVKSILDFLCNNMLLIKKSRNKTVFYTFSIKLIQDIIYQSIQKERRDALHQEICNALIKEPLLDNAFELAYQYMRLQDTKNARKVYLRLAFNTKKRGLLCETIYYLLKALENTSETEYIHIAKICRDLGALSYETGEMKQGIFYLKKALSIQKHIKDQCLKSEILIHLMHIYDYSSKIKLRDSLYKRIQELQKKNNIPKIQAALYRMDSLKAYYANKHPTVIEYALKGISLIENIPSCVFLLINLLRLAGTSYFIMGNNLESEKILKRAQKLAEKANYIRAKLWIELSLSQIYSNVHNDPIKAYAICTSVVDESKLYKQHNTEIVAIDYLIHLHLNTGNIDLAYESATYALKRSKEINYTENIIIIMSMLVNICQQQHKLTEAIDYYLRTIHILRKSSFNHVLPDFYIFSADLLQYIGDIDKSIEIYEKLKQTTFSGEFSVPDLGIKEAMLELLCNKPASDKNSFELLCKITDTRLMMLHSLRLFIEYHRMSSKYEKKIYNMLLTLNLTELNEYQQATVYYIRSFYETSNKVHLLRKALVNLLTAKEPLLRIYCYCELAKHYITQAEYDVAIMYYREAAIKIYEVTKSIQKQFRYSFFIRHVLYVPYYNMEKLQAKKYDELYLDACRNDNLISEKKFETCNKKLKQYYILKTKNSYTNDYIILGEKNENQSKNIITLINQDVQIDINTLLKNLSVDLLATNMAVLTIDDDLRAKIVSSLFTDDDIWASGILDGIYVSSELSILEKNRIQNIVPHSCIDTAMLMPIYANQFNYMNDTSKNNCLGYLYAESYLVLNKIKEKSRYVMETYGPLLGVLLHKWILETTANTDALTGAFSRKAFNETIKTLQTLSNVTVSFLYYDLDSFKSINDTYGHRAGDMVLATVAQVVMKHLTGQEKLYRYGGEEFIAILPNSDSASTFEKAEAIRKAVEKTTFQGYRFSITMSIGISTYGEHSTRIADLIRLSDTAMYFSKRTGKNKTTIWSEDIDQYQVQSDTLSRTIGMDRFWNLTTASACIDILKNFQGSTNPETVLYAFMHQLVKFSNIVKVGYLFIDKKNTPFAVRTDDKKNKIENKNYKDILHSFIQSKQKETQVYPMYTNPNNIFSVDYLICIPLIFRNKYLGLLYGVSPKKKTFSADDISLLTFLTTLAYPFFKEMYDSIKDK